MPTRAHSCKKHGALFVGHDIYRQAAYGKLHPLAIPRVESVIDLCRALDWLPAAEYRTSPQATEEQLASFHDRGYIAALREASASGKVDTPARQRYAIGTMENPLFPGLYERATTCVGGSILAAELALEGRIAFHPAGGTHHGRPDRASGFCYFNDPVFAIRRLLQGRTARVVYVDLDAHHGDGVQDAFGDEASVYTISIHESGRWPHTGAALDGGAGRACNLPVPAGFNDSELGLLIREVVLPLAEEVNPEAIVITCGGDALAGDPLTTMALTNVALWQVVEELVSLAPSAVVLGGGGYNPWTLTRYWTGLWGVLAGRTLPRILPPAATRVLKGLRCDLIDEDEVRPGWLTTLADEPRKGTVREAIENLRDEVLASVDRRCWPRRAVGPGRAPHTVPRVERVAHDRPGP
jgi:acetoin utilization protein AcuC